MRKRQVVSRILKVLVCLLITVVLASSVGLFSVPNSVDADTTTGAGLQSGGGHAYLFRDPVRGTELYVDTGSGVYRFTAPDGYDTGTIQARQMHINGNILIQINDSIHGFNFNCNINFVANHCIGNLTDLLDKNYPRYYLINSPAAGSEENENAIVPATTVVLGNTTLSYLSSVSADESTLIFGQVTRQLSSLSTGDVIASSASALTPDGLLRTVTDILVSGNGTVVVDTGPATLDEAIEECQSNSTWQLLPDGSAVPLDDPGGQNYTNSVSSSAAANQVASVNTATSTQSDPIGTDFYIDINKVLYEDPSTGAQITASGSLDFDITFNFGLTIQNWTVTGVQFSTTATETAQLKLSADVALADYSKEVEIYSQVLDTFVVWIGPVPVVIQPVLSVNVGLDGTVSVGVTTSVTQTASLTTGLEYDQGSWSPIWKFTHSFNWNPPQLTAGCEFKGYAAPQLTFMLYGVAGPYAALKGYLELDADIFQTPWWNLYGGLEPCVGFKMEVLGSNVADYEVCLTGYRILLASATQGPPTALDHIIIAPESASITTAETQAYTATAYDQYNNIIGDVTGETTFAITAGAGGSWADNVYTSQNAGTWTVTGTYNGKSSNAILAVTASSTSLTPTTTILTSNAGLEVPSEGETITLTAQITPIPDGGAVQFLDNGSDLGSPVNVNASGQASYTESSGYPGAWHTFTADYSGDANFSSSTDTVTQIVNIYGLLKIVSGTGMFSSISPTNRTITVSPGQSITGTMTLNANNALTPDAVAPLIGTTSWGDHSSSWWLINSWIPTGSSTQTTNVNVTAPTTPGTYYLIFAFQGEMNGAQVASATNWATGQIVWNDGNDIAGFSAQQIALAQEDGVTLDNRLYTSGYLEACQPSDAIEIIVE
jgi:hypothetical protein